MYLFKEVNTIHLHLFQCTGVSLGLFLTSSFSSPLVCFQHYDERVIVFKNSRQ